jgi:hypothetical protein
MPMAANGQEWNFTGQLVVTLTPIMVQRQHKGLDQPFGRVNFLQYQAGNLQQYSGSDVVGNRHPENVLALEFLDKVHMQITSISYRHGLQVQFHPLDVNPFK